MTKKVRLITIIGLIAGIMIPGASYAKESKAIIAVDGSSTVYPITEAVAEEFQKQHNDIRITVGISGTGGGFKKFANGETDISDASRPIKKTEQDKLIENGIEFIEIPIAYDGLAVMVNPENKWCESITTEELKKLWEPEAQGKITKWSQIRLGWPDQQIHLYGAGTDSGTYDYFTEAIMGKEHSSRGDFTSSEDDNVLVQGIAGDKYALGFFGLAYYEENRDKLKLVPVDDGKPDNGNGPVPPTQETVANGSYQPLSRPIFIYVRKDAIEKKQEVKLFVDFYLKAASSLSKEVGYIPLPENAYKLARERVDKLITGTVFSGSKVGVTVEELLKRK